MNLVKTEQPIKLGPKLGVKERDFALIKMNSWKMYSLSLYMRQPVKPSWEKATGLCNISENRTAQDEYGMGVQ